MFDSKKTIDKLKHENAVLKNRCRHFIPIQEELKL